MCVGGGGGAAESTRVTCAHAHAGNPSLTEKGFTSGKSLRWFAQAQLGCGAPNAVEAGTNVLGTPARACCCSLPSENPTLHTLGLALSDQRCLLPCFLLSLSLLLLRFGSDAEISTPKTRAEGLKPCCACPETKTARDDWCSSPPPFVHRHICPVRATVVLIVLSWLVVGICMSILS